MTPITPHLAEELWHFFNEDLVSNAKYPKSKNEEISEKTEIGEFLLLKIIEDAKEILKITKIKPNNIYLYITSKWKLDIMKIALNLSLKNQLNVGNLMKEIIPKYKTNKEIKQITQYASKLPAEIMKMSDDDISKFLVDFNSFEYLQNSIEYIEKILSCNVKIYESDDLDLHDPKNKSKYAIPLRPAIYIE
jgi:leucyl-tRNA synthetase